MGMIADDLPRIRGHVVAELRDAAGRVTERTEVHNTFTVYGAEAHASALAGEAPDLTLTDIALGSSGVLLDMCDVTTGWTTSSATVAGDTSVYTQGVASLKVTVAASTTGTAKHTDLDATGFDATDDAIEVSLRIDYPARLTKASSYLRVYTGAGSTRYYQISIAAIEAAFGAFADGTWKRNIRIPVASFSVGAGSPSWATANGVGIVLAVGGVGAANAWMDDWRIYRTPDTSQWQYTLSGEQTRKTLTDLSRVDLVVTATAFWTSVEAVGTYYVAGLYAGTTLVAVAELAKTKEAGLTLTVTWTLTASGSGGA